MQRRQSSVYHLTGSDAGRPGSMLPDDQSGSLDFLTYLAV